MSPGPSADFPPLSGGRTADTVRPSGVPLLGGHQSRRRFTKVLTEHGWPVALKPPHELVAEDLRAAHMALSAITGEFTSDDLLGVIFSRFCIGK